SDQYQITNTSNPISANTTSDDDDDDDFRFNNFFDDDHFFRDLVRRYDREGNYDG
ncbi:unnamed protein product, partial [Didymodactylos carnosus]